MRKRIVGLDVTRALAIFGMVVVNYRLAMDAVDRGPSWMIWLADRLDGRASATFVVLAGIGVSLLTQRARSNDKKQCTLARSILFRRACFLSVIGLLFYLVWPADILHFYAAYLALAALLITASKKVLWWVLFGCIGCFVLTLGIVDYESGWNFDQLEYDGFWTYSGFLRNLLFNGFHPLFPWFAFLVGGMLVGRQKLDSADVQRKLLHLGIAIFVTSEAISFFLIQLLQRSSGVETQTKEDLAALLGTQPLPPGPLYIGAGFGIALIVIAATLRIVEQNSEGKIVRVLQHTGQLALTLYLAHVIIGLGLLDTVGKLSPHSTTFALFWSTGFIAFAIGFATLWRRKFRRGPLEWLMRKISY